MVHRLIRTLLVLPFSHKNAKLPQLVDWMMQRVGAGPSYGGYDSQLQLLIFGFISVAANANDDNDDRHGGLKQWEYILSQL